MIDDETSAGTKEFYLIACQHLLALGWYEGTKNADGDYTAAPTYCGASAFLVTIGNVTFLMTAGHVRVEHEQRRKETGIVASKPNVMDYWGKDATVECRTPFDFLSAEAIGAYDKELGVDFAAIVLPDNTRRLLTTQIRPFTSECCKFPDCDYEDYFLVGLPTALNEVSQYKTPEGNPGMSVVPTPLIMSVDRLPWPHSNAPSASAPQFRGRIVHHVKGNSIEGMSGGYILGLEKSQGGIQRYRPVAIQSRWDKNTGIIVACPLDAFLTVLEQAIASNDAPPDGSP